MHSYKVIAINHAQSSENRIHSDDIASRLGFRGALVPGGIGRLAASGCGDLGSQTAATGGFLRLCRWPKTCRDSAWKQAEEHQREREKRHSRANGESGNGKCPARFQTAVLRTMSATTPNEFHRP